MNFVKTTLELTAGRVDQFPKNNILQIALSGRSNVGKSSMTNCLIGRKSLARVSSNPGKTVTVNYYLVDGTLYLVDLPGYGFARRSDEEREKWSKLVDGFFADSRQKNQLAGVIQLIDLKVGLTADDRTMIDYLIQTSTPFFVVATKADKLNKTDRIKNYTALCSLPALQGKRVIPFSAQTGEGRDDIIAQISSMAEQKKV